MDPGIHPFWMSGGAVQAFKPMDCSVKSFFIAPGADVSTFRRHYLEVLTIPELPWMVGIGGEADRSPKSVEMLQSLKMRRLH